jgi:hypothetical protein
MQLPEVTDAQCQQVQAALARSPDATRRLAELREQVMSGALDRQAMRTESEKVYASVGVQGPVAMACARRTQDAAAPAGTGSRTATAAPSAAPGAPDGAAMASGPRGRSRTAVVFVAENGTYRPRLVRVGVSDFDYTEVVSGLKEGEQVALLASAALQAQRQQQNDRFRGMSTPPGMSRQAPAGGGGGGGR